MRLTTLGFVLLALLIQVAAPRRVARAEEEPSTEEMTEDEREEAMKKAEALNGEVLALFPQGKYAEAIPAAREALALREKALGPNNVTVSTSLANFAELLLRTGQYGEARPLLERALAIRVEALGPEHRRVSMVLSSLAMLHKTLSDYEVARPSRARVSPVSSRVSRWRAQGASSRASGK